MIFRKVCKEQGCSFCDGALDKWGNYYGKDGRCYVVCDRCRKILNDILDEKEANMESRFDHMVPLELLNKLPVKYRMLFAYGTVYALEEDGTGVIPYCSDNATRCDAAMLFADWNLPHYVEQRAVVLKKYKILENHRLGQDKEHLKKKLEETRKVCEKIEKRIAELGEKE